MQEGPTKDAGSFAIGIYVYNTISEEIVALTPASLSLFKHYNSNFHCEVKGKRISCGAGYLLESPATCTMHDKTPCGNSLSVKTFWPKFSWAYNFRSRDKVSSLTADKYFQSTIFLKLLFFFEHEHTMTVRYTGKRGIRVVIKLLL